MRLAALLTTIALGTALSTPLQARAEISQPSVSAPSPLPGLDAIDEYDGPEWWMVVGLACVYSVPVIVFVGALFYVSALVVGRLRDDRGSGVWLDAAMAASRRRALGPPRGVTLIRF